MEPIPDGYPRVSPHLSVVGAADAIDFYKSVLGASERMPMGHARRAHRPRRDRDRRLGDHGRRGDAGRHRPEPEDARRVAGGAVRLRRGVDDVFKRAIDAGAKSVRDPEDHFYGDRVAMFEDPFGHRWNVATHIEDVPPEEMERRAAEAMSGGATQ